MTRIYTIEKNKILEYEVRPNPLMEGWSLLTEVDPNKVWLDVYPIMNEALERNRFDSIKKSETYVGLGNLVYYNTREEAQEVLDLKKQFRKKFRKK